MNIFGLSYAEQVVAYRCFDLFEDRICDIQAEYLNKPLLDFLESRRVADIPLVEHEGALWTTQELEGVYNVPVVDASTDIEAFDKLIELYGGTLATNIVYGYNGLSMFCTGVSFNKKSKDSEEIVLNRMITDFIVWDDSAFRLLQEYGVVVPEDRPKAMPNMLTANIDYETFVALIEEGVRLSILEGHFPVYVYDGVAWATLYPKTYSNRMFGDVTVQSFIESVLDNVWYSVDSTEVDNLSELLEVAEVVNLRTGK